MPKRLVLNIYFPYLFYNNTRVGTYNSVIKHVLYILIKRINVQYETTYIVRGG